MLSNQESLDHSNRTLEAFDGICCSALEQLSCVLCLFVFHDPERMELLSNSSAWVGALIAAAEAQGGGNGDGSGIK